MFITIADFWLNGWDDVQPAIPDIPGTATISSRPAGGMALSTVAAGSITFTHQSEEGAVGAGQTAGSMDVTGGQ